MAQSQDSNHLSEEHILEKYVELSGKTYFEVLGVQQNDKSGELKKNYYQLAKKYHPDRLRKHLTPELVFIAEHLFGIISKAYNTLTDPKSRQDYIEGEMPAFEKRRKDCQKVNGSEQNVYAEALCLQGERFLKMGDLNQALKLFHKALQIVPNEPRYEMYVCWMDYIKRNPVLEGHRSAIKHKINQCLKKDSSLKKSYLFLGILLLEEGHQSAGINEIQKYLTSYPNEPVGLMALQKGLAGGPSVSRLSKIVFQTGVNP